MNKLNITINSRIYTVVADEDIEYIKSLCDYVNEKVNLVISEGSHVTGEKPIVLAALNICDEYFKLLGSGQPSDKISELLTRIKHLESELSEMKAIEQKNSGTAEQTAEELAITQKVLDETEEKIKFLEGQISMKEDQIRKQRSEFALREKELLDMLESK